ncbi:MAG: hypothetical protein JRJ85_11910 [Deltaproteobacteria bacterium]|nr:hypothetical protein [Deltaproteobacteria bacterium]
MKIQKKCLGTVFLGLMLLTLLFPSLAKASVSPYTADFGDILSGESGTVPVYITNLDSENPMMVFLLLEDATGGFSIDFKMIQLQPGQKVSVDVKYSPLNAGAYSGELILLYQNNQKETILLKGQGVEAAEQIDIESVLMFFDQSRADGTLSGIGPGKSADKRLRALRNMIVHAGNLMDSGAFEEACGQLTVVLKKIDGAGSPKKFADFAGGEAAPELAAMIEELLESESLSEFKGRHISIGHAFGAKVKRPRKKARWLKRINARQGPQTD